MNDLEICKRIAEIEGYRWDYSVGENKRIMLIHEKITTFNPLIDDALCFKFACELQLRICCVECPAGTGKAYYADNGINQTDYCDTPNRAVCMAKLGKYRYE